jgi:hypothetical protein
MRTIIKMTAEECGFDPKLIDESLAEDKLNHPEQYDYSKSYFAEIERRGTFTESLYSMSDDDKI